MIRYAVSILVLLAAAPAWALEIKSQIIDLAAQAPAVATAGARIELTLEDSSLVRVTAGGAPFAATVTPPLPHPPLPADALPDTVVTPGARNIGLAWLTEPTRRYGHGVLGDAIEAGGVAAKLADGTMARLTLPSDSVFEDRVPRLADLDGDGTDEILVVRSFLAAGAALSVVAPRDGALKIVAQADPIGLPNRWLNPGGAADFDGDGRTEAAVVITPHIGGTLQLYEWRGDRLTEDLSEYGFSNHAMGARELGLSAITDLNGDGVADMVLPDAGRSHLVGLTFAGGKYAELFRRPLHGRLVSSIGAGDLDGDGRPEIAYVLSGGKLIVLSVKR